MVRNPFGSEDGPSTADICAALDDPDCREIITALDEPLTASEIQSRCEIPQSTLYRKLEQLTDATLLEETTEIRRDGHHASKYIVAFDEVRISLGPDHELEVALDRPARTADERLADLWSEVRRET